MYLVFIDSTAKDILFGKIISFKEDSKISSSLIWRSHGNLKIRLFEIQKTFSFEKAFIFVTIKCGKINKAFLKTVNFDCEKYRNFT